MLKLAAAAAAAPATLTITLLAAAGLIAAASETSSASASATTQIACPRECECTQIAGRNVTVCQERGLNSIPRGIAKRTNFLDLAGNRIETIGDNEFRSRGLLGLETILLDGCGVREVRETAFAGLKWLKEVDLSSNRIAAIDRYVFADNKLLEMVNLSGNPIRTLASFQLTALPMLKLLDLSSCELSAVEPDAFSNLLFLESLSLRNNSLATLPNDLFTWLRNLNELDLRANPWRCDCDVQSLVILLSIRRLYTGDLSCTYEADNKTNLWQHMDDVDPDCIPSIESSVKENLVSLPERLLYRTRTQTQTQRFDKMDTGKKIFSSHSVESSFLPIALISVAATVSFLGLVSCYAKCRRRRRRSRSQRHPNSNSNSNSDFDSDSHSDLGSSSCCTWSWSWWCCCCFQSWRRKHHDFDDDDVYDFEKTTCYSNFDEDCSDISLTVEL